MAQTFAITGVIDADDKATPKARRAAKNMRRSLKGAFRDVGRSAQRLGGMIRGALTIGAGVTAGATLAVGKVVKGYIDATDEIGKFSRETGIAADTLQIWNFAAGRQGVQAEDLTKAFRTFAKNMGAAKNGTGELETELKRVDPGLRRALKSTQNNNEAFAIMVDRLSKIKDPAKRARLAAIAFGRSGQKLTRITELGAEGIHKLGEEARSMGLVLGQGAIKRGEEASEAIQKVTESASGLRNSIGKALIPVLIPMLEKLSAWLRNSKNQARLTETVGKAVRGFARWLDSIDWDSTFRSWGKFFDAIGAVWNAIGGATGALTIFAVAIGAKLLVPVATASAAVLKLAWTLSAPLLKAIGKAVLGFVGLGTAARKTGTGVTATRGVFSGFVGFLKGMGKGLLKAGLFGAILAGIDLLISNWGKVKEVAEDFYNFVSGEQDKVAKAQAATGASATLVASEEQAGGKADILSQFGIGQAAALERSRKGLAGLKGHIEVDDPAMLLAQVEKLGEQRRLAALREAKRKKPLKTDEKKINTEGEIKVKVSLDQSGQIQATTTARSKGDVPIKTSTTRTGKRLQGRPN